MCLQYIHILNDENERLEAYGEGSDEDDKEIRNCFLQAMNYCEFNGLKMLVNNYSFCFIADVLASMYVSGGLQRLK